MTLSIRPYSHRLLRGHKVVALGVALDHFQRLAGLLGKHPVELLFDAQNVVGVDLDIGRLALRAAGAADES